MTATYPALGEKPWRDGLRTYIDAGDALSMEAATSVGATQILASKIPSNLKTGSVIAIDAHTTQCELRSVSSIAGSTVTLDSALKFAHSASDSVVVIENSEIHVRVFGITASGADEWGPLQRLFRESVAYGGITIIGGAGRIDFQQPLLVDQSSEINRLWLRSETGFAPVDANGGAILVGIASFFFTATASNDTITKTGHGVAVDQKVAFNAPYGETLPGGIVAGRVYYAKTVPDANNFTISETLGGATFDITSDGAGYAVRAIETLSRVFWHTLRLDLEVSDLNGIRMGLQQPSWTRNLRVEMNAAATSQGSATGVALTGQLSDHYNVETNTNANCIGISITGNGHAIHTWHDNGFNSDDTGMVIAGDYHTIDGIIWTEGVGRAGIELSGTSRGISLNGTWLFNPQVITEPGLLVTSTNTSYELGVMRAGASSYLMIDDTARGFQIKSWSGSGIGTGDSDTGMVFHGLWQPYGTAPPRLKSRSPVHTNADFTVRRRDDVVRVDCAGGNRTITIPTAVGWTGWTTTIINAVGANTATIDPIGAETVGGAATLVLTAGQAATIYADGTNYLVIGRN